MTAIDKIKALNKVIHDNAKSASNPPENAPESVKAVWDEINLVARCVVVECCKFVAENEIGELYFKAAKEEEREYENN